jgi:hypothetical protein
MPLIPFPIAQPLPISTEYRITKADFMASNHKLSALLKGRIGQEVEYQTDRVLLTFKDGSRLQIKTATAVAPDTIALPSAPVRAVRQNEQAIMLDFEVVESKPDEVQPDEAKPEESSMSVKSTDRKAAATTITINTAEATACVMLRDAEGTLEYAD